MTETTSQLADALTHARREHRLVAYDPAMGPADLAAAMAVQAEAGQIITTGTLSGCPYVDGAHRVMARIEGLGVLEFSIE